MPICFDRKIAFVHIPKTGGTSVIDYLKFKKDIKNFHGIINDELELSHLSLNEINEVVNIENYFKFCFVRNPWDRLVSEFFFSIKSKDNLKKLFPFTSNFDEFVLNIYKNSCNIKNNKPSHYLCNHFKTQSFFVYSNNVKIDFLGRFENFNNDLKTIGKKFNIENKIRVLNNTDHMEYSKYFSKKSKLIVDELYGDDIKNFDYKFNKVIYFI
jgi:chondroitin 4-sulfotransferase 11